MDITELQIYAFDIFVVLSYVLYSFTILGVSSEAPKYLTTIDYYVKIYISLFNKESAISSLELIYKYFADFKDSVKEPKTKTFTIKFKEKINKLH